MNPSNTNRILNIWIWPIISIILFLGPLLLSWIHCKNGSGKLEVDLLQDYNSTTNQWDLKGQAGVLLVSRLFQGGFGSYIGKGVTGDLINVGDGDRGHWDFSNSPTWLDFITERFPDVVGFG